MEPARTKWKLVVFLTLLSTQLIAFYCKSCFGQIRTYEEICTDDEKYSESVEWIAKLFESQNPAFNEHAEHIDHCSELSERVHGKWGKFYYKNSRADNNDLKTVLSGLADSISKDFENAPQWWLSTIRSIEISPTQRILFKIDKTDSSDQIQEQSVKIIQDKIVFPNYNEGPIQPIPVSYLTFGNPNSSVAILEAWERGIKMDNLYACVFDPKTSSKLTLWCISRTGRLQWMQSVDFVSARSASAELASESFQGNVSVEFKIRPIGGSEIHIFGAWSDSLFVASFEAVSGKPRFVFNSGSFPVRKVER